MDRKAKLETEQKLATQDQRPTISTVVEELKATHSAIEKAELLLSNLEKLKAEVATIEARYNILNDDYSKICNDAISKISAVKIALDTSIKTKIGDLEVFEPPASNLEARFKLGLVPPEIYLKEKRATSENVTKPAGPQLAIDKAADGIERGLDKLGDALVFPIEKLVRYSSRFKAVNRKKERRYHI
jgi:hypothetical protein